MSKNEVSTKDILYIKIKLKDYDTQYCIDINCVMVGYSEANQFAEFLSNNEAKASNRRIKASKFLIATGARARPVEVAGLESVGYLTNEEALDLKELPDSLIVIGGRTLGLEFAQMFAHFGTKVTVLQRSDAILPEDEPVSDEMQTSVSNIWAAGDVTGEPMLEALAAKEGAVAVHNAFGNAKKKKRINKNEIPSAVFTYPEVARVGLTEKETNKRGIRCNCQVLALNLVPKAQIIGDTRGLVKLVVDWDTKKIVGVHMIAPHAADLIHEGVLAVKFGLTIDDIIDTVHMFPTISEGIKLAAQSFYKDVGALSCCTE
jgi:pyruvate/2-oxoglutarate dehydrogenase complex dihydrolipoamide dehydrogenase (E3) component